jgi:2-dehydro-3-deoxyphosphogluconate aldolase/(4S)-4-hydroxy-2-oxoglutarate aldolase
MASVMEHIRTTRVVAIFRGNYDGKWLPYANALLQGGLTAMEITLNSEGALAGLDVLRDQLGDQIALGAGTVLTAEQVRAAADHGATFIVTPDTDEAVIAESKKLGLIVIPGAYTPTEIKRAYTLGADMVKVFPAQTPEYIKAIRAPLGHIPMMATGGVDLANAEQFMKAGASALGIGSYLTQPSLSPDEVAIRAARFAAVTSGRQLV